MSGHYHNWLTLSAVGYALTVPTVANTAIKAADTIDIIFINLIKIISEAFYNLNLI